VVVFKPCARALASPSEAGSMPTIHTGLIAALRSAFTIRSVPMLPEPINAALILLVMPPYPSLLRNPTGFCRHFITNS
jgi:hypothetical protein